MKYKNTLLASRDITILLQLCLVNLVTILLYHGCIRPLFKRNRYETLPVQNHYVFATVHTKKKYLRQYFSHLLLQIKDCSDLDHEVDIHQRKLET